MKNTKIMSSLIALSIIGTSSLFSNVSAKAMTITPDTIISTTNTENGTSIKVSSGKGEPFTPSSDVKSHVEVNLNKIENIEPGTMQPNMTVSGPGGSATIDTYYNSIYWKVKPATSWPYTFEGYLEVNYYDGHTVAFNLSGFGLLGSSCSDSVPIEYRGGYSVSLSGIATDVQGTKFVVLPNCQAGYGL